MRPLIVQNAWVLTYLTFSRFAYLLILFPIVLKFGRRASHRFEQGKRSSDGPDEQRPLLAKSSAKLPGEEANHFDVSDTTSSIIADPRQVILAFLSVILDTIALVLVSLSKTYQQVLGCKS